MCVYYLNNINPDIVVYSNSTFNYNTIEFIFYKGDVDTIYKTINSTFFKKIDPDREYTGLNSSVYTTVGEFYINCVITKMSSGIILNRENISLWLKIFNTLLSMGFISSLDDKFLLYTPRFLKVILLILIRKNIERRNSVINKFIIPDISLIISAYI
jgi:hypothetical protein